MTSAGMIATNARNIEPGKVILDITLSINSAVFFPGLTPGNKTTVLLHIFSHLVRINRNSSIEISKHMISRK